MKNLSIPKWAGLLLVPLLAYVLNNFVFVAIPYLDVLPDLGFFPYATTSSWILGMWFALRGEDVNALTCEELCTMCGVAGTMVGLTDFVAVSEHGDASRAALHYVFITGLHGILFAKVIKFTTLWTVTEEKSDE